VERAVGRPELDVHPGPLGEVAPRHLEQPERRDRVVRNRV
jgi:hypothetical protein